MGRKNTDPVQIPSDLSSLGVDELSKLKTDLQKEFAELDKLSDDEITTEDLNRMAQIADGMDSITGRQTELSNEAAERIAARESLRSRMQPTEDNVDTNDTDGGETGADSSVGEPTLVAGGRRKTDVRDVIKSPMSNLNARLSEAGKHQPPTARPDLDTQFGKTVLVASADIAGFASGGEIPDMKTLVRAMQARARALPDSRFAAANGDWTRVPRYPVASMQRDFKYVIDPDSTNEQAWALMQEAANPAALVASGGWCSPSEIRYDFYDIASPGNTISLPTTGIRRGGMRWPTSPSFGSLAASTGLWHWNETQDTAAATGTDQSGTKTCAIVPCASFEEARLEFEGICITAGNLTTDAWPEQLANFMHLVDVAHGRRVNAWLVNNLVSQSTSVSICPTGIGVAMPLLDSIEMQVIDLRQKYAMVDTAILECKMPTWVMAVIRADLAKRMGVDPDRLFSVTNQMIAGWFTQRGVNLELVDDWQVRAAGYPGFTTPMTSWSTSIDYLLYPAGTFVRGNGLRLDFGVLRDSTLNATNDYTAAWSEESMLIAKIGHESRVVTVPICPNGVTAGTTTFGCTDC